MGVFYGRALTAGGGGAKPKPEFYFNGNYQEREDGVTELLSSGTIRFYKKIKLDLFLVGGGAGGTAGSDRYSSGANSGAGGGGGYTKTIMEYEPPVGEDITVTIGNGGDVGNDGGATSFGTYSANGGSHGKPNGGNGGSGGAGAGNQNSNSSGGRGGSDGGNGATRISNYPGGSGQGTTTREFGEATGKLYAGGGGSGGAYAFSSRNSVAGGEGGGGDGAYMAGGMGKPEEKVPAKAGTPNTGGGGGGGGSASVPTAGAGGGSGIVCFRPTVL